MTTLQQKWDKYKAAGFTGSIRFSKEQYEELNGLHKEMFNKNMDRSCGKCTKAGFEKVFKKLDYDKKHTGTIEAKRVKLDGIAKEPELTLEIIEPEVKKVAMTFPKHEPKTDKLSDVYGDINDNVSIQFHANMLESIRTELWKHRIPMQGMAAFVIGSEIYENALLKKGISVEDEGEVDFLVCLEGTTEEIEKQVKRTNPRFIHSNMSIPGYHILGSSLREGQLYRR